MTYSQVRDISAVGKQPGMLAMLALGLSTRYDIVLYRFQNKIPNEFLYL